MLLAILLSLSGPALVEIPGPLGPAVAVDDTLVQALKAHLAGPGCRLVPAFRGGRAVGVRLFGIRPGSPLAREGFENGDILVAADGVALTTPAALLALSTSTTPTALTIERRGVQRALLLRP